MTYECMVLVAPSLDLSDEKAQKALMEKLVGDKAVVKEVSSLGKKKLAYPVSKHEEATYLVAILEGTVKSGDLDTKAKLMDDVLRVLLTIK